MSVVIGAYCALCRGLFSQDIIKVKWINKMNDYFLNQIHYDSLAETTSQFSATVLNSLWL